MNAAEVTAYAAVASATAAVDAASARAANAAELTSYAAIVSAVAAAATAVIAFFGFKLALRQLKNLRSTLQVNSLQVLLTLEADLNTLRTELDQIAEEPTPDDDGELHAYSVRIDFARKRFLTAADRFCFCMLKEYFLDHDWQREYRRTVEEWIEDFEEDFGPASRFRNILKLRDVWQEGA